MATCDLHMHTHYSDARPTPEELVRHAAHIGLKTIAITDHDNMRGSREAQPVAEALGIELIPAIEFGTRWEGYGWPEWGGTTDLLGYFLDDTPDLRQLEHDMLATYDAQVGATCDLLTQRGYPLTLKEVHVLNPHYVHWRQGIAVLGAKGLGDPDTLTDAWNAAWCEACDPQFTIDRIIAAIHAAGGVAVLAHPTYLVRPDGSEGWITADDLAALVEMGLDGIEIYHYRLDEPARAYFMELARRFDLAIGGGSDEHGWPSGFPRLGSQPVTPEMVSALRARRHKVKPFSSEVNL